MFQIQDKFQLNKIFFLIEYTAHVKLLNFSGTNIIEIIQN